MSPCRYALIPEYISAEQTCKLLVDIWFDTMPSGILSILSSDEEAPNPACISEIFNFAVRAKCAIFTNGTSPVARMFGEKRQNLYEKLTHSLVGFVDQANIKFVANY